MPKYDSNENRTNNGYVTGADNLLLSDGTYTYQYDKEGNRTKRTKISDGSLTLYFWDYENRLVQETSETSAGVVTQVVTYTYDFAGRMIREGVGASLSSLSYTYTVYDGQNAYLQVSDTTTLGGTGTPTISQRYLYGPAADQILATETFTYSPATDTVLYGLGDNQGPSATWWTTAEIRSPAATSSSTASASRRTMPRSAISSSAWTACATIW